MNRIKTEHTLHNGKAVVKLIFGYDAVLVAELRKRLPAARWSRTMRCWHIPDTPEHLVALKQLGIDTPPVVPDKADKPEYTKNEDLINRFGNYMKERRYSLRTIEGYTECLRIFFNYLGWKDILEIGNEDVDNFNRNYILARKLSATYQSQFVNARKLFYAKILRKYHPVTWLFEGDKPNTPYAAESLHKVFTAAKRKAGIVIPFKLHGLRHCYATHLMEAGVNLRYVQELLGHRHIKTTEIYLHVNSESISKIQSPFDTLDL